MSVDMSINLGGLIMKNPVTVASGTFGSGIEYSDFFDLSRLGAVTTKGVSQVPWTGNATPRIAETDSGMLNSIGLQNPGVEKFIERDLGWLATQDVPVIVNVCGHAEADYAPVIDRLEDDALAADTVSAYEINISCPNVDCGGMAFGSDPVIAARVIASCRAATKKPLFVKLTPNVTDITVIAKAIEEVGADAVSLINTILGMSIDASTRRPKLARVVGGLSGPAIKPVALRMVYQVAQAVDIPVLGMGGIANGIDAVEFMLAGATAVAVGTANFIDPYASVRVIDEIEAYCNEHGVSEVRDLIGALEVS